MTPNVLAAALAASAAFGTKFKHAEVDRSWLRPLEGSSPALMKRANAAAEFIRGNPDAPVHALPIHLKMKGFGDLGEQGPRELAAFKIFKATLEALDAIDKAEEAVAPAPQRAHGWPGREALQVQRGPFDATGYTPR